MADAWAHGGDLARLKRECAAGNKRAALDALEYCRFERSKTVPAWAVDAVISDLGDRYREDAQPISGRQRQRQRTIAKEISSYKAVKRLHVKPLSLDDAVLRASEILKMKARTVRDGYDESVKRLKRNRIPRFPAVSMDGSWTMAWYGPQGQPPKFYRLPRAWRPDPASIMESSG